MSESEIRTALTKISSRNTIAGVYMNKTIIDRLNTTRIHTRNIFVYSLSP